MAGVTVAPLYVEAGEPTFGRCRRIGALVNGRLGSYCRGVRRRRSDLRESCRELLVGKSQGLQVPVEFQHHPIDEDLVQPSFRRLDEPAANAIQAGRLAFLA